jgi:hypothetical protein
MIVDILHTADYARRLSRPSLSDMAQRPLGWRFWYGGPWMAAQLITARRPVADATSRQGGDRWGAKAPPDTVRDAKARSGA